MLRSVALRIVVLWAICALGAAATAAGSTARDEQPAAQQSAAAASNQGREAGDQKAADQPPATSDQSPQVSYLTAFRFHLGAESIRTDDPRFDWDAHFGGDVDALDYGYGRVNFLADYEVVLGHEFRHFDPNQSSYHLDVSASWRFESAELQAVFHHTSRHLGDRANTTSVAWNTVGARLQSACSLGATRFALNVHGARVTQSSFVDYTWQFGGGVDAQYPVSPRSALVARGTLDLTGTDEAIAGRSRVVGGRAEAGIRLYGKGAGIEAYAGVERRVDPSPLQRDVRAWPVLGFRFVSR